VLDHLQIVCVHQDARLIEAFLVVQFKGDKGNANSRATADIDIKLYEGYNL